jgi:ATP-dependent protease HslVU (ClpYQ) peptidase subunit
MAGDGTSFLHERIIGTCAQKVRRLVNGALYGAAGETTQMQRLAEWIEAGSNPPDWPDLTDVEALVLNPDGTVDLIEAQNKGRLERVELPIAIGSGMEAALGAMDAGADPRRAVEIACRRSATCGGEITSLTLSDA